MANGFRDPIAQEKMEINARYALAYEAFARERGYDALAVSCWPKFQDDSMYSICAVVGELNDRGIVTSCEGDLVSAVSMLFLKYIADDITMLMDMSAVDIRDDTVIGAGSVVTKDIPAGVVAVGNPCRVLREINERDRNYYFRNLEIDIEIPED